MQGGSHHLMFLNFRTRSRVRTRSWLGTGELCRPTRDGGYRGVDLTCVCFRAVNQERTESTKRLGGHACSDRAWDRRGASLDRAVAHDRARRPWHHLRSAPRASRTARRSNWTIYWMDARSSEGGSREGHSRARRSHRREGMPPTRSALRLAALGQRAVARRVAISTASP